MTSQPANYLDLDDGTVVDLDTGEIVQEGTKAVEPSEYLAYMALQFHEAKEQAASWESQRKALGRTVARLSEQQGVPSFEGPGLKFSYWSPQTRRKSHAALGIKAVEAEVLTDDDLAELLIFAARDLDAKAVEQWIADRPEETQKVLRALLIEEYQVAAHMRSTVVQKDGKRRVRTADEAAS